MKDLISCWNEMDTVYRIKSDCRWPTFRIAMNLFLQREGTRIVETGCARQKDDWGGGQSTLIFGDLCSRLDNGTHLWTVDLSPHSISQCKSITTEYSDYITYTTGDSIEYLKNLDIGGEIDLLYLDSYDYPYGRLLELYGGREDLNLAEQTLLSMPEEEIVSKHWDIIRGSQEHCVKELEAALPHVHDYTVILIDDNMLAGGGKPRLAKKMLRDLGYICLYDFQQTLWIKEGVHQ